MASAGTAYVEIKGDLSDLNKSLSSSLSSSRLGALGRKGGLAIASALTAASAAGKGLFDIGQEFADATATLRVETGKTGGPLRRLKADFRSALRDVPATLGDASEAVGGLNQRLGLTGQPLRRMTRQVLELSHVTKTDLNDNIEASSQLFRSWAVPTNKQAGLLDRLFRIFQKTGLSVADNARLLTTYQTPLQQLGISLSDAAAMFGKFDRAGVNTSKLMSGLRAALKAFTDPTAEAADALKHLGIATDDPKQGLKEVMDAIKQAPSDLIATQIAFAIFGKRAGPDLAQAIRQGRFELGDMNRALKDSDGSIHKTAESTRGFREEWQLTKNQVFLAIEPIATRFFRTLTRGLKVLSDPKLTASQKFDRISSALEGAVEDGLDAGEKAAVKFGPRIALGLVRGFFDAPPVLQLVSGAWLLTKNKKLLAAAGVLGRESGSAYGAGFASSASASTAGGSALGGVADAISVDPISALRGGGGTTAAERAGARAGRARRRTVVRPAATGELGALGGGAVILEGGFRSGAPVSQLGPRATVLERIGASRTAQVGLELTKRALIIGAALTALDLGTKALADSASLNRKRKSTDPVAAIEGHSGGGTLGDLFHHPVHFLTQSGQERADAQKVADTLKDIRDHHKSINAEQLQESRHLLDQIKLTDQQRTAAERLLNVGRARSIRDSEVAAGRRREAGVIGTTRATDRPSRTGATEARGLGQGGTLGIAKALTDEGKITGREVTNMLAQLDRLPPGARTAAAGTIENIVTELSKQGKVDGNLDVLHDRIARRLRGLGNIPTDGLKRLANRLGVTAEQLVSAIADPTSEAAEIVANALDAFGEGASARKVRATVRSQNRIRRAGSGDTKGSTQKSLRLPKARGGLIPGVGLHDTVPLTIGRDLQPGDAIATRHQQLYIDEAEHMSRGGEVIAAPRERIIPREEVPRVDKALRRRFDFGIQDLFRRVPKPHYLARGGMIPGGPSLTTAYGADVAGRYAEPLRQLVRRLRRDPDEADLLPAETRTAAPANVLSRRDRLDVLGVDARPHAAQVIDLEPRGDVPVSPLVEHPVPVAHGAVEPHGGVPRREAAARPDPARRGVPAVLHGVKRPLAAPMVARDESPRISSPDAPGVVGASRDAGPLPTPTLAQVIGHAAQSRAARGGLIRAFSRGGRAGPWGSGAGFIPVTNFAREKFGLQPTAGRTNHDVHTTTGNVSDHSWGGAVDYSNGVLTPQEDAFASFWRRRLPQVIKQLIWRNKIQLGSGTGGYVANHENHVHVALQHRFAFDDRLMDQLISSASEGGIGNLLAGVDGEEGSVDVPHLTSRVAGPPGPVHDMTRGALRTVVRAANRALQRGASSADAGAGGDTGDITGEGTGRALMESISKAKGWRFADWWALDAGETSHGRNLSNATSTARLRGQFLDMNYGKYGPGSDPAKHPSMRQQIISMGRYIAQRYGNPTNAYHQWLSRSPHYYDRGGLVESIQKNFDQGGVIKAATGYPPEAEAAYDYSHFGPGKTTTPDKKKKPKKKRDIDLYKAQHMGYTPDQWDNYIKTHHGRTPKQDASTQTRDRAEAKKRARAQYIKDLHHHRNKRVHKIARRLSRKLHISDVLEPFTHNISVLERRITGLDENLRPLEAADNRDPLPDALLSRDDLKMPLYKGDKILDLGRDTVGDLTIGEKHIGRLDPQIALLKTKEWFTSGLADLQDLALKRLKRAIKQREHQVKLIESAMAVLDDVIDERRKKKPNKERINRLNNHLRTKATDLGLPRDSFVGDQGFQVQMRKNLKAQRDDLLGKGSGSDSTTAIPRLREDVDSAQGDLDQTVGVTGARDSKGVWTGGGDLFETQSARMDLEKEREANTEAGLRRALEGMAPKEDTSDALQASLLAAVKALYDQYASNFRPLPLPRFARGGMNMRTQLALVGEEGPEVVKLPAGARVFTHAQSQRIAEQVPSFAGGGKVELPRTNTGGRYIELAPEQLRAIVKAVQERPNVSIDARSEFKEQPADIHNWSERLRFQIESVT